MQIKPHPDLPPPPAKPQLHTHKHHDSYSGARHVPKSIHIRGPLSLPVPPLGEPFIAATPATATSGAGFDGDDDGGGGGGCSTSPLLRPVPVYEVTLLYPKNRACTILRAEDDFLSLRRGLASWWRPGKGPVRAPSCPECWAVEDDTHGLARDHRDHQSQQALEEQQQREEVGTENGNEEAGLDIRILDRFLRDAIKKRPNDCAMGHFFQRRAGDCGGG